MAPPDARDPGFTLPAPPEAVERPGRRRAREGRPDRQLLADLAGRRLRAATVGGVPVNVHGKVWGTTALLFCRNNVELHRITGVRGGYSSRHHHSSKFNLFFVERGTIVVRVWRGSQVDETQLMAGMTCTVPPGDIHQFEVLDDDTVAFELYWT